MANSNDNPNQTPKRNGNNRPDKNGGNGGKNAPQNFMSRGLVGWLLLGGLVIAFLVLMNQAQNSAEEVSWKQFREYAQRGAFSEPVVVEDSRLLGLLPADTPGMDSNRKGPVRIAVPIQADSREFYLNELKAIGQDFKPKPGGSILLPLLINFGPVLLIILLIYFFVFRAMRNAGGGAGMLGSFGRSRHKMLTKEHSNITLADVAGIDEAKEEVFEIIEFLKNPKKFQRLGGRVPRGVLLIGDPGCGKTLLAKAVAGEADVPFFSISGSDFVEMFVGVGASRVRDLFKQAKDSSPCIIFIDEIDAVARRRSGGLSSGGHDEREQTLNAILVEMDGFETNDQVIVMAATNRNDVLDPALIRPGRFDRQIHVPLPDLRGRMEILRVHAKKVKMGPDVDLEKIARGTPLFSGADLAALINEAAIAATLAGKDFVEMFDMEEARDKVKWGRAMKSRKIDDREKRIIAYHEAGHALVMYHDSDSEPLHKVTIIPRGQALGVTFMLPERDKHIFTKRQMMAQLRVTFGGRIAEDMFCGDISSGAAMDIRQASAIARAMVTRYGMSEKLGFLLYGTDESRNPWEQPERLISDETARQIDDEVKKIIDTTYEQTRQLLEQHRDELERLAQALLRYETLNRDEVDRLMKGQVLLKPTVSDLLKAEADKAASANGSASNAASGGNADAGAGPGSLPQPA